MASDDDVREIDLRRTTVDITRVYDREDVSVQVSPKDLLGFAKGILLHLFALVVFVFALSYLMTAIAPDNTALAEVVSTILDVTKTAVPSIVTLVLGFYFGRRDTSTDGNATGGR